MQLTRSCACHLPSIALPQQLKYMSPSIYSKTALLPNMSCGSFLGEYSKLMVIPGLTLKLYIG